MSALELTAKAQRWALLLTEHRATFAEVVRLSRQFPRDIVLGEYARQARSLSSGIEREARDPQFSSQPHGYGSLGKWGQNGHAPRIRHLLTSARARVAALSARTVKVAA
ncbi:MAG: hypothetical protein GY844_26445 [Bradyrhizobium sp.]|jgi:hypothetical protein|uniref:hypothetical protein n=1 Tax=Sphingomonas sp. VL_57B TaxID=3144220 RepID=UPI0031F4B2C5|nr:hypothetical protein [Bradyrhizobium sp.]